MPTATIPAIDPRQIWVNDGMELLTLVMGGAAGFGVAALERLRLSRRIRSLLTALPDTSEVADTLSLASLVRREINFLQGRCRETEAENAYWQQVMNLSPLGYLLVDAENHLEWCNQAAQSLLQIRDWRAGERRLFLEFIRSYELDQLIESTRQSQRSQCRQWHFFPPLTTRQGNVTQVSPEAIAIQTTGYPLTQGRVAIFIENQQLLAELRQGRDRAFSDLAHELRTPLTAIALITERLQAHLPSPEQTWGQRLLKEITRLQNLVESWLYLTEITDNPNVLLEIEPINLRRVLDYAWERLEAIATEKQLQLQYQGSETLPLEGDGDRLMQVFMNLLDNAIKHSPLGSTILVTGRVSDSHIVMTLRDQGEGFNPKDLPYIFERLYRGDPSRARLYPNRQRQGSGLGLAIAKEIMTAHHGQLTAANHPQEGGAQFTLTLPQVPPPPELS